MDKLALLIADGNSNIRNRLKQLFANTFERIDLAADGITAMKLFRRSDYNLVILDTVLPVLDGKSVCRQIKKSSDIPVIVISERGEESERLKAYDIGAEDYLVKPFSEAELLARVRIILRRSAAASLPASRNLVADGIFVDTLSRVVYVDDLPVSLTLKEYELLLLLMGHPGHAYSRSMLLDAIWGGDFEGTDRTVDTHIKTLRSALRPYHEKIATVWGFGYKFEP